MKNHKIEEKEYLDCFLQTAIGKSWHGKHNIVKIEETESPDFIFETNDGKKIGLEIKSKKERMIHHRHIHLHSIKLLI